MTLSAERGALHFTQYAPAWVGVPQVIEWLLIGCFAVTALLLFCLALSLDEEPASIE
jgi:hypothetical protein